jgi:adenylate cyclase
VTEILNAYFTEMMSILFAHDGTYDKFIGDALLAFFGDPVDQPDHPARALACALAMQEKAAELRIRFSEENLPPLHIGIAVHTGPVVVGNHGSRDSWSYTVIGDTVNLASRLQGLAQKDDIIMSRSTAEKIPGFASIYRFEELDPVTVKGKTDPVSILRVFGRTQEEMRS